MSVRRLSWAASAPHFWPHGVFEVTVLKGGKSPLGVPLYSVLCANGIDFVSLFFFFFTCCGAMHLQFRAPSYESRRPGQGLGEHGVLWLWPAQVLPVERVELGAFAIGPPPLERQHRADQEEARQLPPAPLLVLVWRLADRQDPPRRRKRNDTAPLLFFVPFRSHLSVWCRLRFDLSLSLCCALPISTSGSLSLCVVACVWSAPRHLRRMEWSDPNFANLALFLYSLPV